MKKQKLISTLLALVMAVSMCSAFAVSSSALSVGAETSVSNVAGLPKLDQKKLDTSKMKKNDPRKPFVGVWRLVLGAKVGGAEQIVATDLVTVAWYNDGTAETYLLGKLQNSYKYKADGKVYTAIEPDETDNSTYAFSKDGNMLYFYYFDTDNIVFGYERIA